MRAKDKRKYANWLFHILYSGAMYVLLLWALIESSNNSETWLPHGGVILFLWFVFVFGVNYLVFCAYEENERRIKSEGPKKEQLQSLREQKKFTHDYKL